MTFGTWVSSHNHKTWAPPLATNSSDSFYCFFSSSAREILFPISLFFLTSSRKVVVESLICKSDKCYWSSVTRWLWLFIQYLAIYNTTNLPNSNIWKSRWMIFQIKSKPFENWANTCEILSKLQNFAKSSHSVLQTTTTPSTFIFSEHLFSWLRRQNITTLSRKNFFGRFCVETREKDI